MSILTHTNNNFKQVTMVSLEIVDFINAHRLETNNRVAKLRHADFMAKVPKVLGLPLSEKFRSVYVDPTGRELPCYKFEKREACLMAMSYSYELQAQIFDRMTAMENALKEQTNQPNLNDPHQLRSLLLGYAEQNIQLQQQVEKLEPKALALDAIADTGSLFRIRDAAQAVGVPERKFIQFLMTNKWVYRDAGGTLCAYSHRLDQKVMQTKVTQVIETPEGTKVRTQAMVTAKGITRLAALVEKAGLKAQVAA